MPPSRMLIPSAPVALLLSSLFATIAAAQPPAGYRNYEQFRAHATKLAELNGVQLSTLGTTAEDRDVVLLTLSSGKPEEKPAILILGSVTADNLIGSHLASAMAEAFAEDASLLEDVTLYIIPRPSPDASERLFASPVSDSSVNSRPTDDDRDGVVDEDPPEDLSGDGLITAMRVKDEAGEYIPHPDEPRLMVKADPAKGERGEYRLLSEGVDNDGDEKWNEDGPGGVDFNRNFTFEYPYFEAGAGPNQVSEPESRAVANFAYDHPNVFLVFSFAPQDNLNHVGKPKSGEGRIKRSVQARDVKYFKRIAESYKELIDPNAPPAAAEGQGGVVPWGYYHFGRWSVATRGWWPPKQEEPKPDKPDVKSEDAEQSASNDTTEVNSESETDADKDSSEGEKPKPDERAAEERRRLAWLDKEGIAGFVPWKVIENPDFPNKIVEVGGFKPGLSTHPPVSELKQAPFVDLVKAIAKERATAEVLSARAEPLGKGVVRVTAEVINRGGLPTASEMGKLSQQLRRLEVELKGPDGMTLLDGPLRQDIGVLSPGGVAQRRWLVRLPVGVEVRELRIHTGEPSVGFDAKQVEADKKEAQQ